MLYWTITVQYTCKGGIHWYDNPVAFQKDPTVDAPKSYFYSPLPSCPLVARSPGCCHTGHMGTGALKLWVRTRLWLYWESDVKQVTHFSSSLTETCVNQWFSTSRVGWGEDLAPGASWPHPKTLFGGHNSVVGGGGYGLYWAETREVAEYLAMPRTAPHNRESSSPKCS